MRPRYSDKLFYGLLLTVFFLIGLAGIITHEIWLDEAHHWLIAKDSNSLKDLYVNMRYDGHPILWNILLFYVSRIFSNVFGMQLLNLILSTGAVWLFLFYAPFKNLHKALFVFGYFIIYEYTVISRNYALMLLLAFVCLAIYPYRKKYPLLLGAGLALLVNTHLFGLIMGCALVFTLIVEFFIADATESYGSSTAMVLGLVIALSGISISIIQVIPPADTKLVQNFGLPSLRNSGRMFSFINKGFIPAPDLTGYHFWNSNFIAIRFPLLNNLLSLGFLFLPLFIFSRKALSFWFFYSAAFLLMMFFLISDMYAVRYYGMIYVIFIAAYWLSEIEPPVKIRWNIFNAGNLLHQKINVAVLTSIMIIHVVCSVPFYFFDLRKPFSEAEATANYLRKKGLDQKAIAVEDCLCTTVSAYLNKPLYYLAFQKYGTYCSWNDRPYSNSFDVVQEVRRLAHKHRDEFVFIHPKQLELPPSEKNIVFLASFNKGMVQSENYYVYLVNSSR